MEKNEPQNSGDQGQPQTEMSTTLEQMEYHGPLSSALAKEEKLKAQPESRV